MSKYKYNSLLCPGEKVTEEQLATDRNLLAFDREIAHLNRRGFLSAFMSAAAVAAVGVGASEKASAQAAAPAITDVLNFALNLEYLEANFYSVVSTGAPISASLMGTSPGALTGTPGKLALDPTTQAIALALAQDEENHIATLRSTITSLGGTPISQPAIYYGAKGPITTQAQFLAAARQFTAVGGSAYVGSANLVASNTTVLTAAAQILGAEGQHGGTLNYQCIRQGVVSPAVDAQDIPPTSTQYFTVFPVTAFSPSRNTSQVLGIVYGASTAATTTPPTGITMGGFFPNGVNGNIKST